jgi:hypothetical protein
MPWSDLIIQQRPDPSSKDIVNPQVHMRPARRFQGKDDRRARWTGPSEIQRKFDMPDPWRPSEGDWGWWT